MSKYSALSVRATATIDWMKVIALVLLIVPGLLKLLEVALPDYTAIVSAILAFVVLVLESILKIWGGQ